MSSDFVKRNLAAKDMKTAISQFEQKGKENSASGAQKPATASAGVKPPASNAAVGPLHKALPAKQESGSSLVTTTLGKFQSTGSQQPEEAANQFKMALKPVKSSAAKPPSEAEKAAAKPSNTSKPEIHVSGSSVSSKSKVFENPTKDGGGGGVAEAPVAGESLVSSRSSKFETLPRQTETGSSRGSSSSSFAGPSMKERALDDSWISKTTAASKPVSKSPFVAGMIQGSGNIGSSSGDKKVKDPPTEPDEKGRVVQNQKLRTDGSQEAVKYKIKAFANEQETKLSIQRSAHTQDIAGKSGTLTKKNKDSSEQTANKAEGNEETCEYANEHLTLPPRASEKLEKTKHPGKMRSATTAEEAEQPKVPSRNEEKAKETKTIEKTSSKKSTATNQQNNETKRAKIQDKFDQIANKKGTGDQQSLQRNKAARPVPPPTVQKGTRYRLLPVPKPSGNAPRKLAKPPAIDLGKFVAYAKSKGLPIHQFQSQYSVASFEDGGDLYEECVSGPTGPTGPSRISEYTEEEEADLEKMAKNRQGHKKDNRGNTSTISHDEYADDDEIYQEID